MIGVPAIGERSMQSRAKLFALNASLSVVEFALDGVVLAANENFLKTFGYALHHTARTRNFVIIHAQPDDSSVPALADGFGRVVTYLRVSVTNRCDLRCTYCMSEKMHFLPSDQVLRLDELDRICSAFVARAAERSG